LVSFFLDATEGFSGKDTFAAIVSNLYGNETFVFTTANGVYQNYNNSKSLAGYEGFFEFDGNNSVSTLWRQAYGSSCPILSFWSLLTGILTASRTLPILAT
jgi:hypothetical protein